ncbi:MAG: hypothetical protein ACRC92_11280 [Peptostreptococcaceae bacterium]
MDYKFYGNAGSAADGVPKPLQSYRTSSIYNSVLELDTIALETLTPWITGRGFAVPDTMAYFMEAALPNETEEFKALVVSYCTGFDGVTPLTAVTTEVNSGIEHQSMEITTGLAGNTKEVTLTFPAELRGQFFRRYTEAWMKGTYDNTTSRTTYLGLVDKGLRQSEAYQVMSSLWMTTDPTFKEIEYCAYVCNMSPKTTQTDMNNYKRGEHNITEVAIPFKCQYHDGNRFIFDGCKTYLDRIYNNMENWHEYEFSRL